MSLPEKSRLASVVSSTVELLGYEFVACEMMPQGKRILLRVYIDSEKGITVRDCEIVSKQLGSALDVEDLIRSEYYLEVSSPGEDRLLVTLEHYQRFVGHRIKVKLRKALEDRRNYTGLLKLVSEESLTIVVDGDTYTLPLSDIEKAKIVPDS